MDTRRNRNWTISQAAFLTNRNYVDHYSSVRLQNARNLRQTNVQQYRGFENNSLARNQPIINREVHEEGERGEAKKKKKRKDDSIIKQFCQETSFHGFNYLGEENRSNLERAFWIVVLAFFYYESVQLLIHGYRMFNTRTVIINIDGSPPLVSDIPFPALTVCSSNQITKSGLERVENNTVLREYKDDIISHLCHVYRSNHEPNVTGRKLIDSSLFTSFIQQVGCLNCSKTIIEQYLLLTLQKNSCHNMQQIVTFFGVCHTFNMLPLDQLYTESFYHDHYKHQLNNVTSGVSGSEISWTPENGYKKSANFKNKEHEIPYRTTGVSFVHSLILEADLQENDFTPVCNRGTKGFFIIAHNPAELPGLPHPVRFIQSDRISVMKVKTTTHKLDKRLISWKPAERKCYLEKERSLKFFRYYTEQNCRLECQTNFTLLLCGCVPFYLPRGAGFESSSNQENIVESKKCYEKETEKELTPIGMDRTPNSPLNISGWKYAYQDLTTSPICGPSKEACTRTVWSKISPLQSNKICKCLPSCTELTFSIDFTNAERNKTNNIAVKAMYKGITKFQIFYKDNVVASYRRLLLFDWNDGVALLGGIMCLFCGGSFLSFFELINFFIFRVIKPKKTEHDSRNTAMIERYRY